jgi:hypothetical protein
VIRKRLLDIAAKAKAKPGKTDVDSARADHLMPETSGTNVDETVHPETACNSQSEMSLHSAQEETVSDYKPITQCPPNYPWTRLDAFSKFLAERDEIRLHEGKRSEQIRIRDELDKQVADINQRKHLDRIENLEFYRNLSAEAERSRENEKQMEEERKKSALLEKQDREAQQKDLEERRKQNELKQAQEDATLVASIENDLKRDQDILLERKSAERARLRKLMSENEAERQIRVNLQKQLEAEELRQLQEYHRLLEKQDRERQDDLRKRVERQKSLIKKMEEKVMQTIQEKSYDDNVRAEKQQAEIDARAIEITRYKAQRLAEAREDLVSNLKKQMDEKINRLREEEEMRRLHATVLKSDLDEYQHSEEERARRRKAEMRAYRQELDHQVESRQKSKHSLGDEMNAAEMQINRELIQLVESVLPPSH